MRNLFYFLVGFCLAALLLPALSFGDDLQWDACTGATGYIVHFTDGTNNYIYLTDQIVCPDIDTTLNLPYGMEVTFHVTSYNDAGESGESNMMTYTRTAYVLPENNLPPTVINVPGPVTININ